MKTLYLRIVVTTIIVMIVSSVVAFIFSNSYYQISLKPFNDQKVTQMVKNIVDFYEKNPNVPMDDYLDHIAALGYQLYLVDQQGHGSFYGGAFRNKEVDRNIIEDVLNGNVYHGISEFQSKAFITGFFDNVLTNTIGMSITVDGEPFALFVRPNINHQFGEMRIFFSVLLILTILLSILFVAVSTRYLVKPIVNLTEATKRISQGKYNFHLNVKRRDEIGTLAENFSKMATSIEQLEEMRQEFVSNVSHEIQSPLASIQGFSQTLQAKNLTEDEQKHYLSIIEDESRRLSQLSKQLLTLASLDKEEMNVEKSTFDVAAQMKQVVFMTEWSWREKELAIDMDLPSILLHADQKLLHQVWTNLLTNSIKYTGNGGSISVRMTKHAKECHIEIQDTGIGIAATDLPHIFDRFYKADKSRNRKEGSSGLGLAITKKIIDLHDGKIHVESQLGKGTVFHVYLPTM